MQFRNQHRSPQHANDPLHMDQAGVVRGFFLPVFVGITLLIAVVLFVFASDYLSPFVIMLIAMGVGVACGLSVLKSVIRGREKHANLKSMGMHNAKKAETQKQIDAMLKGNSNIPKVKK